MALIKIKGDPARRYRDTETGDIVSRHTAEIKQRLADLGWKSAHQRATARKSEQYARWERWAADKGIQFDAFERRYAAIENDDFNNAKDGLMADFLVDIGAREPDATYAVGSTPPKRR
jgi:hypothetical protein